MRKQLRLIYEVFVVFRLKDFDFISYNIATEVCESNIAKNIKKETR